MALTAVLVIALSSGVLTLSAISYFESLEFRPDPELIFVQVGETDYSTPEFHHAFSSGRFWKQSRQLKD